MMHRNTMIRSALFILAVLLLLGGLLRFSPVAGSGMIDKLLSSRKQAINAESQKAIQAAERLFQEARYAEAFRRLFDAMYQEERLKWLLALMGDDTFSSSAAAAIQTLENRLVHELQSPLMQWLRDPEVPLQERLLALKELRDFAEQKDATDTFREQYNGPLIQLLKSSTVSKGEKFDVLFMVQHIVQHDYVSALERENFLERLIRLQQEVQEAFSSQRYVETFVLLTETLRHVRTNREQIPRQDYLSFIDLRVNTRKNFVLADTSSLMQVFKNRKLSVRDRQRLLYKLKYSLEQGDLPWGSESFMYQEQHYDGTLVQILLHPKIDWLMKHNILGSIDVQILEKEPGYVPEVLLDLSDEQLKELGYLSDDEDE